MTFSVLREPPDISKTTSACALWSSFTSARMRTRSDSSPETMTTFRSSTRFESWVTIRDDPTDMAVTVHSSLESMSEKDAVRFMTFTVDLAPS